MRARFEVGIQATGRAVPALGLVRRTGRSAGQRRLATREGAAVALGTHPGTVASRVGTGRPLWRVREALERRALTFGLWRNESTRGAAQGVATSEPQRSHVEATSAQVIRAQGPVGAFQAFHSPVRSGDNRLSFWLFPVFPAEKTGGSVPDPERPDGSSPALPTEFHEGRTRSRCVSRSRGRAPLLRDSLECRDLLVRARQALRQASYACGLTGSRLTAASTRACLPLAGWSPHVLVAIPEASHPWASCVLLIASFCGRSSDRSNPSRISPPTLSDPRN